MDVQKRKRITKADRLRVFNKYGGHCAYCGREMEIKEMQVDHMIPHYPIVVVPAKNLDAEHGYPDCEFFIGVWRFIGKLY